ncbi:hypothetical protein XK24_10980, partial [Streptococcus suis]
LQQKIRSQIKKQSLTDCFFTSLKIKERVMVQWTIFSLPIEIKEVFFLLFVKSIKVFDEKYFEFNSQNK